SQRTGVEEDRCGAHDGPVQFRWRHSAAERIDILQVLPKKIVEEDIALRREIRAVPPEPIASFRRVDFAERRFLLRGRKRWQLAFEKIARLTEESPRAVLFLIAYPDVEVAADPRAGVQCCHRALWRPALE